MKKTGPKGNKWNKSYTSYMEDGFIARAILHIGFYSLALILAYNLYKEGWKGYDHVLSHFINMPELPHAVRRSMEMPHKIRHSIRETFPWAILVFSIVYFAHAWYQKERRTYLPLIEYVKVAFFTEILLNLIFVFNQHVLITLNLSFPCFFFILFLAWGLEISIPLLIPFVSQTVKTSETITEYLKRGLERSPAFLKPIFGLLITGLERGRAYVEPLVTFQERLESNCWVVSFAGSSALVLLSYLCAATAAYLPTIDDLLRSDHWFFLTLSRSDSSLLDIACFNMFGHPTFDLLRWTMFHWLDDLFGNNIAAYHLLSISVHAINGLLLFLITKTILRTDLFPFLLGLLFVVMASHFDTVSWAILFDFQASTLFTLLALLFLVRYMYLNLSIANVYLALLISTIPVFLRECFVMSPVFILFSFAVWGYFSEGDRRQYVLRHVFLILFCTVVFYSLYFYAAMFLNPNVKLARTGVANILDPKFIFEGLRTTLVAMGNMCFLNNLGVITPRIDISCLVYLYPPKLWSGWLKFPVLAFFILIFIKCGGGWRSWYFALPVFLMGVCSYMITGIGRMSTGGYDYIISRSHYAYFPNVLFLMALGLLVWPPKDRVKKFTVFVVLIVLIPLNFKNVYYLNKEVDKAMNGMNMHYQRIKSFLRENSKATLFLDFVPSNDNGCFGLGNEITFDVLFPDRVTKSVQKATHIYDSKSFKANDAYSPDAPNTLGDFTVQFFMCSNRPETLSKEVPIIGSDKIYPRISLTADSFIQIAMKKAPSGSVDFYSAPYPPPMYRDFRGQDWTFIVIEKCGKDLYFIFNGILRKKFHLDSDYLGWQEDGVSLLGQYYRGVREEVQVGRLFVKIGDCQYKCGAQRVGYVLDVPIEKYTQ